jgi:hypothetical protein
VRPGLLTHEVHLLRKSNLVAGPAAAAQTMTLLMATMPRASLLKVTVANGTTGSGTVTATGTAGATVGYQEAVAFAANGVKRGTTEFTAITHIGTTGLTNEAAVPTVTVEAVDTDGNPQHALSTIATGLPSAKIVRASLVAGYQIANQGQQVGDKAQWNLDYSEAFAPREGDLIEEADTGDRWMVRRVDLVRSGIRPFGWQLDCDRYQTDRS